MMVDSCIQLMHQAELTVVRERERERGLLTVLNSKPCALFWLTVVFFFFEVKQMWDNHMVAVYYTDNKQPREMGSKGKGVRISTTPAKMI